MADSLVIRHPVGLEMFTDVADMLRKKHGEAEFSNREMVRFANSLGLAELQWKRAVTKHQRKEKRLCRVTHA